MSNKIRKGFTLIELLIVVVIIGILAAIAIPKFANTKEKAYLASMKSDLRNMATVQEAYFADYQLYIASGVASNLGGTTNTTLNGFVPSAGVSISSTGTTGVGWVATSTHTGTSKTCAIGVGVTPPTPALVEGEPKCTP
jgi:type IV pilus assembly protein PilA